MDLEEELESHIIRKEAFVENTNQRGARNAKYNKANGGKQERTRIHDYMPAIVKHVLSLNEANWEDNSIISIQNGRVRFRNCLIYGDVLCKLKEMNKRHKYILDDGTGCLEVSLFCNDKQLSSITRLQRNLSDIFRYSDQNIVKSLRNILTATKDQVYNPNIMPGTKVLLYGKPQIYLNTVSLDVYHILEDSTTDRSMEIAFKDELVDWYKKYILPGDMNT